MIAKVDLTEPRKGIVLLTGKHGFPEDPQALLGPAGETGWSIDDSYGDLGRDGETERDNFFSTGGTRPRVLRNWFRHLGVNPEDVTVKTEREY